MEHLHQTEFGSKRYLEKLNRSQSNGASPVGVQIGTSSTTLTQTQIQSPFILPIRGSIPLEPEETPFKTNDQKRSEKKGFLGFRSKFHNKSAPPPSSEQIVHLPSSTQPVVKQRCVQSYLPIAAVKLTGCRSVAHSITYSTIYRMNYKWKLSPHFRSPTSLT